MAGPLPDRFKGFQIQIPGDASDPEFNPGASNRNGLSDKQRFVLQNLFDTQLERRRGFLKQLGYEMSDDGAEIRPLDHKGKFKPIDPSPYSTEGAIKGEGFGGLMSFKELITKGKAEAGRDLTDLTMDTAGGAFVGGAATAGGAVGSAAGLLAGPGAVVASPLLGLVGATTAGAAANAGVEVLKMALGDLYLDENIPMNLKDLAFQSVVAGGFSGGGHVMASALQKFRKMGAENLKKALAETFAVRSNGKATPELVLDFMTNPERYTPDKVKGATERSVDFVDNIFGTDVDHPKLGKSLKGGVHGKVMDDLNKRAELALEELSHNPEANFTVEEIIGAVKGEVDDLNRLTYLDEDQEAALGYLNKQLAELKASKLIPQEGGGPSGLLDASGKPIPARPSGPAEYEELTFDETRQMLGRWQKATFPKGKEMSENPIVGRAAHELRVKADDKASSVGSNFPAINAKRNEIFTSKQALLDVAKGNHLYNAYIGKVPESKIKVQRALARTDEVLGTRLQEGAETIQFQKVVEQMNESPTTYGSGGELADAMRGGLQAGTTAGIQAATVGGNMAQAVGAPRGVGARVLSAVVTPGKVIRAAQVKGAFASPDILIKKVSKINSRIDDLSRYPKSAGVIRSAVGQASQQTEGPARDARELSEAYYPPLTTQPPEVQAPLAPPPEDGSAAAASGLPDRFAGFKVTLPEGP